MVGHMACKEKKHPRILIYQSNIASKPASGMQSYALTEKRSKRRLKQYGIKCIEPIDNMTCFVCRNRRNTSVESFDWR